MTDTKHKILPEETLEKISGGTGDNGYIYEENIAYPMPDDVEIKVMPTANDGLAR